MTRRQLLRRCSTGFGAVALSSLLNDISSAAPLKTHHAAKAKHVIFLLMSGGVSHVDSFDPKPKLKELHGKPMPVEVQRTQFNQQRQCDGQPV